MRGGVAAKLKTKKVVLGEIFGGAGIGGQSKIKQSEEKQAVL